MSKMLLIFSGKWPGSFPEADVVCHWEERAVPAGHISVPRELDALLLDIRTEHMRWAYETGFLPIYPVWGNAAELQKLLRAGAEPSMWWTSLIYERHPKLSPNLYIIYKLRVLEKILETSGCSELMTWGADRRLEKTLARMCRKKKLGFISLKRAPCHNDKSRLEKLYAIIPAPLRAILRYVHWWWNIRRHLPFVGNSTDSTTAKQACDRRTAAIITYFPNLDLHAASQGRFRSRYWESLHEALNAQASFENPGGPHFVRWIFIRFPSPQLTFSQCLTLRDIFQKSGRDGLSFNYLEEFIRPYDIAVSLLRWLRLCASSLRVQGQFARACRFHNSEINFWPFIREQWAESFRGWRCLERCLLNRAFQTMYRILGEQRWNLFPLENCPWERMLTQAAHACGAGPVYGVQHSIIRPTDFRYFDDARTFSSSVCNPFQPDVIGGNGASALEQWLQCGMPPDRARQVEALRYLYLAREKEGLPANPAAEIIPPEPGEPAVAAAPRTMLVLTSFFADETNAHLALLEKCLNEGVLDGWSIIIKPHPYLSVANWLERLPEDISRNIRITEGPLALELRPGISVWASNSTTAALEAVLKGLGVMVMRPVNDFDLCPIQNVKELCRTGTVEDVRECLDRLAPLRLSPDYLDLNPRLTAWRKLLNLNFTRNLPI